LILIYDSNRITIEGSTDLSISEDITKRFESQGWDVLECDGHNFDEIMLLSLLLRPTLNQLLSSQILSSQKVLVS